MENASPPNINVGFPTLQNQMNWGTLGGYAGAFTSAVSSIGYFAIGDIRRGLYFLCCTAITLVVIWPS